MHSHSRCWKYSGDRDKVIAPTLGHLKFIPNEISRLKAEKRHPRRLPYSMVINNLQRKQLIAKKKCYGADNYTGGY